MNSDDKNSFCFNKNTTQADVKKYLYPYKKTGHVQKWIEQSRTQNSYDDTIVDLLKTRLLDESNTERFKYFTTLIEKINYIDSSAFNTLKIIINKVLRRTDLYNPVFETVNLIERFIGKKIVYSPEFVTNQKKYNSSLNLKPREELSPCGKYIHTYCTTKDLQGKIVASYYMSKLGIKGGLSDQYYIFKMKQVIENNKPEFDNWITIVEYMEKLYSPETFNNKEPMMYNTLDDYEKEFDKCKKVAYDLGWIKKN